MDNTDLTTDPLPWPQGDEVLFTDANDWQYNACLNFCNDGWELYATGYKEAADVLVRQVLETQSRTDVLIYPIAFLYRHYLELRLKEIIVAGKSLLDHEGDLDHVHLLDKLWNSSRKILEEVWSDGPATDLDAVENCILQFTRVDRLSMGFRYPVTKEGKPSLPGLMNINIRNLRDVMERISAFLDACSMGIGAELDNKHSMLSDFY